MKRDPICLMEVEEDEAVTLKHKGKTYYFCSEGCRDKFLQVKECAPACPTYDLIIIGGGPAGLTAAVYAATMKVHSFLIAKDLGGQAIDSTKIENYMGYDFITGPELIAKFKDQLIHSNYIDHLMSEVEKIEPVEGGFRIATSELNRYTAKTLIVTTGMRRRKLNVPGEEEFQRKGVLYGNVQDFSFVEGEDVAVIGGGNSALQMVENLHTVAKNIHIVSDIQLTADAKIIERINNFPNVHKHEYHKVIEFLGNGSLSGVVIRKKAEEEEVRIPIKGVFIAIGLEANSSLVSNLVELNERGEIVINPDCSTSYPGIFAAGDITNAYGKRIIIASGEGAKAALAARQYLLNLSRKREVKAS